MCVSTIIWISKGTVAQRKVKEKNCVDFSVRCAMIIMIYGRILALSLFESHKIGFVRGVSSERFVRMPFAVVVIIIISKKCKDEIVCVFFFCDGESANIPKWEVEGFRSLTFFFGSSY